MRSVSVSRSFKRSPMRSVPSVFFSSMASSGASISSSNKVIASCISKELIGKGWPEAMQGSLKSRAAAYLTGLMLGNKVKSKFKEAILDSGMNRNVKKSRIYAAVKGFIDSGIKVPCSTDILPSKEEMVNEKTSTLIDKLSSKV